MKNELAVLLVDIEAFKKMGSLAQFAAAPVMLARVLNLLGKMIDEIDKLKGAQHASD